MTHSSKKPYQLLAASALAAAVTFTGAPRAQDPSVTIGVTGEQIEAVAAQIAAVHQVPPPGPIDVTLLPAAKIRERVRELIMEDYDAESLTDEGRLLVRMGLLSEGTCYEEVIYSVLQDQVVGLYDPRHEELLLVPGSPPAMMQEVLAHEVTHAVQDSGFDIGGRLQRVPGEMDRRAGLQAVTEGDALLMEQLLGGVLMPESVTPEQIRSLMQMASMESDPFLKAPAFIRETLLFPYVYGLVLVRRAYAQGGYEAVNALLVNPPESTEQVLHPERMVVDPPLSVSPGIPQELMALYRDAGSDVMGEFQLRQWLTQWIGEEEAARAATGWGGDGYRFLWPTSIEVGPEHLHHGILILLTRWDEGPADDPTAEARQFEQALMDYVTARYPDAVMEADAQRVMLDIGGGQTAVIERRGKRVLYIEGLVECSEEAVEAMAASVWTAE